MQRCWRNPVEQLGQMEDAFSLRTAGAVSMVPGAAVEPDEPGAELRVEVISGVVAQIQSREKCHGSLIEV
ncbi:MAG: hypothetical protein ACLPVW_11800 [Terriglobales bacterium]